ncbi:hypothetical protein [Natronomonas sp. EA1]
MARNRTDNYRTIRRHGWLEIRDTAHAGQWIRTDSPVEVEP